MNKSNNLNEQEKKKKRYYRKQVNLFNIIAKIKLWPSRSGILHGVKYFTVHSYYAEIITHCNEKIILRNSKNSRAARWLRNKWFDVSCPKCKTPRWKLEKYGLTMFNKHWGSQLEITIHANPETKT